MGYSILRHREIPWQIHERVNVWSQKGMRLTFLKLDAGKMWQHKWARRHRRGLLEELSFLFNRLPALKLNYSERGLLRLAEQFTLRTVRCVHDDPWKSGGEIHIAPDRTHNRIRSPRLAASGQLNNVDKGIRQNRSVTSGKGLALRIGYRDPLTNLKWA